jgi:hypothetical protein
MRKIILSLSILLAWIISASAQNTVSFDNQSGEPALVKLIGPTSSLVEVPDGTKQTVKASAGKYFIKVRYGVEGKYHYTKGQEFKVDETATTTSAITITLHKVVNGNYDSSPINEQEFGVADATAVVGSVTNAQPSISSDSNGKASTFLPAKITAFEIPSVDIQAFFCTPVKPLNKGEEIAAQIQITGGQEYCWSTTTVPLLVGTNSVQYPILALQKNQTVYPVVLKAKVDIKAGDVIHSDGYEIEVKRSVKAGYSIPAVCVIGNRVLSVLSVEAAEGANKSSEAKPWFTAFKEDTKANDRDAAIEAWRIEKNHVGQ